MSNSSVGPRLPLITQLAAHLRIPLYRNAYALVLSSGITSGLGFVFWILAARSYSADAIGINSAALSAIVFLANLSLLNLMSALNRFVPTAGRHTHRLIGYSYGISLVLAAVSSLVFIAGVELWAPALGFLGSSSLFVGWFTLTVMVWSIFVLQDSALIGLRMATWVPVENTIFAILKIILLVSLAPVFPNYGVLASWTMPLLLLIVPVNVLIFRVFVPRHIENSESHTEPLIPAQIGQYVAGDYVGTLLMEASYAILPLMVIQRLSPAANAHYYVAWIIGYALYLFGINMGQSLLAEGAAEPSKLDVYGYRMLVNTLRLMVPVVAVVILCASYILSVFGKSYAQEATAVLRLLALSALPYVITTIYLNIARVRRRMLSVVAILSTICVLTLSFSYLLMGSYGITGIGLAWLLSQTIVAAYLLFGTRLRTAWLSGHGRLTSTSMNG